MQHAALERTVQKGDSAVTVICLCAVFYFNLWMQVFLVTSQYMVILRARFRKFVVVDC